MKKPVEDLSKLPKWAQHRIVRMESDIKALMEVVSGLNNATSEGVSGKIIVEPYSTLTSFTLRDRSMIRFKLRKDRTGYIDVGIRKGMLNLNSAESLIVMPGASNDLHVAVAHRTDLASIVEDEDG